MHIFSVVIWMGGLMFQSAVVRPILQFEDSLDAAAAMSKVNLRFVNFVWMCVWTILMTGVLMMLLDPRFLWFHYDDAWSVYLGIKQVIFFLLVFYAFGYARMLKYLTAPSSNGGVDPHVELYRHRIDQFRKISIFLGIVALLLSAAMVHFV